MKFLGDVPIGLSTIELLRKFGHDAIRAIERLPPTATDYEIVQLAICEERIIVCFDLDFSAIVATSGQPRPSVLTFRTSKRSAAHINHVLSQQLSSIESDLALGVLATIEDTRIRVRPLPVIRRRDPS